MSEIEKHENALLLKLEALVREERSDGYDCSGHGCCMPDCNYDMSHGAVHTKDCASLLAELDKLRAGSAG